MRISHKYKFVFLALPRTGSTTVRKVLDQYSDIKSVKISQRTPNFPFYDHITAPELKEIFDARGWAWKDYRKFCVVRNPYDRVVSLYHHHLKIRKQWNNKTLLSNIRDTLTPPPSFPRFVSRLKPQKKGLTMSLDHFIGHTVAGKPSLVDDVLMFGNLEQELPAYLETFGIRIDALDIPHLNASSDRSSYRKYYDEATRQRVEELYRYTVERFGYTF